MRKLLSGPDFEGWKKRDLKEKDWNKSGSNRKDLQSKRDRGKQSVWKMKDFANKDLWKD